MEKEQISKNDVCEKNTKRVEKYLENNKWNEVKVLEEISYLDKRKTVFFIHAKKHKTRKYILFYLVNPDFKSYSEKLINLKQVLKHKEKAFSSELGVKKIDEIRYLFINGKIDVDNDFAIFCKLAAKLGVKIYTFSRSGFLEIDSRHFTNLPKDKNSKKAKNKIITKVLKEISQDNIISEIVYGGFYFAGIFLLVEFSVSVITEIETLSIADKIGIVIGFSVLSFLIGIILHVTIKSKIKNKR